MDEENNSFEKKYNRKQIKARENKESGFIPIREVCNIIGLKYYSARSLLKKANIKSLTTPSGQTLYNRASLFS